MKLKSELATFRRLHTSIEKRLENAIETIINAEAPRETKRARLALTRSVAALDASAKHLAELLATHAMFDFSDIGEGLMADYTEEPAVAV